MRYAGLVTKENVGISNDNAGEKPAHRKTKVSPAMLISRGQSGPNANPKGVVDGQQINISVPAHVKSDGELNLVRADGIAR